MAARGLYHQGFALHAGKEYEGYLALKAGAPTTVHVRLEDWGSDPAGLQGATPLAHAAIHVPGHGEWALFNFSLTPSAATRCVPFPVGAAPLNCGVPKSQTGLPPSATGTCKVCGGTLTVSLEDAGTAVAVDQVFLEPGDWGRFKGLHMHKLAAEWVLAMGTRMLRYGGTFTETVQGHWKAGRGPSWQRPPCTAGKYGPHGGGRGGCHLTKLARWTRGWDILEVLQFCEAAGLAMCTVGVSNSESVQDMADLVEYLYGGADTHWGAIRAADGHPQPYPAAAIEISNESCMENFVGTFAAKIAAMEAVARLHGIGGKLRYVTGSYLGITTPNTKCQVSGRAALVFVALCADRPRRHVCAGVTQHHVHRAERGGQGRALQAALGRHARHAVDDSGGRAGRHRAGCAAADDGGVGAHDLLSRREAVRVGC